MKRLLTPLLLIAMAATAQAQKDSYGKILRIDPALANGYFIVDTAKWRQLNVDHINVDIVRLSPPANGAVDKAVVQSFTIHNNFFGKADLSFLPTLEAGQAASYHLQAIDAGGKVVVDVDPVGMGTPGNEYVPYCMQSCVGNTYAWSLTGYFGPDEGNGYVEMRRAVDQEGAGLYFYVPHERWEQFTTQYQPGDFGLSPGQQGTSGWNGMLATNNPNIEAVIQVPATTEMRDEDGYPLVGEGMAYGIPKLCGPWRWIEGQATQDPIVDLTTLCGGGDNLRLIFNADSYVQSQMAYNLVPPVTCNPLFPLGGGLEWGGVFTTCTAVTVYTEEYSDGTIDILGWMMSLENCAVGFGSQDYLSRLSVSQVDPGGVHPVVDVELPPSKDAKLIRFPKTRLNPGLYEFRYIGKNGSVLRHFEEFTSPVTLNSHFSAFADINIYPVPVKGPEFAVEFNLAYPLQLTMMVIDNKGHEYMSKHLNFTTPGLNKEVFNREGMSAGLYHAIFQFDDGSTSTRNFSIGE